MPQFGGAELAPVPYAEPSSGGVIDSS